MSERNSMLITMLCICALGGFLYEYGYHISGLILMVGSVVIGALNLFADV